MSQLDALIARSRSPGAFVERRRFTLSREKAIEKQREFALRHPGQYVLELVQAAVFAGATYLALDTRPQGTLVAWVGGPRLAERDLEHLLDYLFADRADPRTRHLVQLAVGVNAMLQRKPRTLRIESGDGARSVRMDLDPTGRAQLGVVEQPIAGTYVYAEFARGWLSRFTGAAPTTEQALIEERCLYTPVPILLNGAAPFGWRGSRHIEIFGAREQVHFDDGGRRGVVAIHASERALTGFRIVVGGVWITTLPLEPLARRPLVGVVCDDGLRKTADHADIVQDGRFVEMLHAVQPHATRLMVGLEGPRYRPPELPPIPRPAPAEKPVDAVVPEPLPPTIPSLAPRLPLPSSALDALAARRAPVFWCAPDHAAELIDAADPVAFPYRVLVLSPGQAATLERRLPGVPVHRVASRADLAFVRRVLEREGRVREHAFPHDGATVRLRLHRDGPLPDWGADEGLPFAILRGGATVLAGAIVGERARIGAAASVVDDLADPWPIAPALDLPGVSVVVEIPAEVAPTAVLDDRLAARILDEAWRLAAPEHGEPDRRLLAAVLGQLAVPQLVAGADGPAIGVVLPPGAPDRLLDLPIATTTSGPLSLAGLLDLLGTDRVVEVTSAEELDAVDGIEARFGYGHLTRPELARPIVGVGRVGERWMWLDRPSLWQLPALTQVVWVAGSLGPGVADGGWALEDAPVAGIVAARRADVAGDDWARGYDSLFRRLLQLDAEDGWARLASPVGAGRTRALGRLALLRLAAWLDRLDQPLLMPSDGGARRSLRQVRTDPGTRVVASHGVVVAEPGTYVLTRDELAAVAGGAAVALRYDDAPEVWRSLTDGPDTGWLLRQEVREGGVSGWLGLRHPYDATTGILVRAAGRLVAVPELERRIACHGLVWPDGRGRGAHGGLTDDQLRLLRLAGLRMVQELGRLLREGALDPDRAETARRYAFVFAERAWRRGRRTGTALELARSVEIHDGERVWGTLEQWLRAPVDQRPAPPVGLGIEGDDRPEEAPLVASGGLEAIAARLTGALAGAVVAVRIARGGHEPVQVVEERSTREEVRLLVGERHPLARGAAEPGRTRELLLLEAARQVAVWGAARGLPIDLLAVQHALVAQRLDQG